MKKSILHLEGVQQLSKREQAVINGGFGMQCNSSSDCRVLNSLPGMEHERFFCFWGYCQIA
ncbi:MAG: hypothetical protein AAF617_07000 [Bacteroidota bacterium]